MDLGPYAAKPILTGPAAAGWATSAYMMAETIVSAPGKVMVAGGYVVLERPNAALVAAVSARIYAAVKCKEGNARQEGKIRINVRSAQLDEARDYVLHIDKQWNLEQLTALPPNPYVESSVIKSLMVIHQLDGRLDDSLELSIYGDNAFYSIPSYAQEPKTCPRFAKIARKLDPSAPNTSDGVAQQQQQHAAEVQKTGLGSSAALVTAIVGALLSHSGLVSLPDGSERAAPAAKFSGERALALVHNLSQLCHCAAQVSRITSRRRSRTTAEGEPNAPRSQFMSPRGGGLQRRLRRKRASERERERARKR